MPLLAASAEWTVVTIDHDMNDNLTTSSQVDHLIPKRKSVTKSQQIGDLVEQETLGAAKAIRRVTVRSVCICKALALRRSWRAHVIPAVIPVRGNGRPRTPNAINALD